MGTSQRGKEKTQPSSKVTNSWSRKCRFAAGQVLVEMHVTNWAVAQKEDPELDAVLQWLGSKKKADLGTLLGECITSKEGQIVWRNHQNFTSL